MIQWAMGEPSPDPELVLNFCNPFVSQMLCRTLQGHFCALCQECKEEGFLEMVQKTDQVPKTGFFGSSGASDSPCGETRPPFTTRGTFAFPWGREPWDGSRNRGDGETFMFHCSTVTRVEILIGIGISGRLVGMASPNPRCFGVFLEKPCKTYLKGHQLYCNGPLVDLFRALSNLTPSKWGGMAPKTTL